MSESHTSGSRYNEYDRSRGGSSVHGHDEYIRGGRRDSDYRGGASRYDEGPTELDYGPRAGSSSAAASASRGDPSRGRDHYDRERSSARPPSGTTSRYDREAGDSRYGGGRRDERRGAARDHWHQPLDPRSGRDYQRSRSPDYHRRDVPPPREGICRNRSRSPAPATRRSDRSEGDDDRWHDVDHSRGEEHAHKARPSSGRADNRRGEELENGTAEADEESRTQPAGDEQQEMMAAMGFGGFGTTKGKKIDDASQLGYAKIKQERTWRQYMNRKGGFNRILDKIK